MTMKKNSENATEQLAEETAQSEEKFEPDFEKHPMPELDDLSWDGIDDSDDSTV